MIFKSDDGTLIFYESKRLKKAKASLLLVHGLGEHSGRYASFIKRAHKMGLDVHVMDLRGHGRSTGVRGHVDSFAQYYADLDQWIQHLENSNILRTEIPCFILGHSLGGLICLNYVAQRKEVGALKIAGLALSAPALGISSPWSMLQYQFSKKIPKLLRNIHLPNGINPALLTHDKEVVRAYEDDPLVHSWVTPAFFQSYMDAVKALPKLVKYIKIPVVFLVAGTDSVVSSDATLKFAAKLAVAHPDLVTTKVFHGFYHEIFNETKKDRVDLFLKKWILACLSPKKKVNLNPVSSKSLKRKVIERAILH